MDLISSRQMGMGPGPIWWTTIEEYCERKGLSEEQTDIMHIHINLMDTAYLKHMTKKS